MDPEDLFKKIVAGGVAEVDRMVTQKITENFILDYKLTGRPGKAGGISDKNREIFSKAVSGFGNAHGGVIIWGVDCREKDDGEDIPRSIDPIPTMVAFKSALENWTQHATRPVHTGVRHEILYYPDGEKGLIVTYIPEGIEAPYEAQYPAGDEKFYWRTGSTFTRVDYGPLSRMFGNPRIEAGYGRAVQGRRVRSLSEAGPESPFGDWPSSQLPVATLSWVFVSKSAAS